MMGKLELFQPTAKLRTAFLGMAAEFNAAGDGFSHYEKARDDFPRFLEKLDDMAAGRNLDPGIVLMNTYWLVEKRKIILGLSRLRHSLTPALRLEGGHIGYAIRPSARRQGYGTRVLELTLLKARGMRLDRVMVTCDADNIGSKQIIEKNGGHYSEHAVSPRSGKQVIHYWIEL